MNFRTNVVSYQKRKLKKEFINLQFARSSIYFFIKKCETKIVIHTTWSSRFAIPCVAVIWSFESKIQVDMKGANIISYAGGATLISHIWFIFYFIFIL